MSLRSSCSIHLARTAVGTSAASGGSPPLRPALWGAPFGASLPPLPADLPTARAPPEVSEDQKIRALRLISTPSSAHHKGSSGRIVVIGGSRDYSGAPYFSAMAALRAGVDMATIVTTRAAAPSLKAMSPDLIVRGAIPPPPSAPFKCHHERSKYDDDTMDAIEDINGLLNRSHALIIGPGMASFDPWSGIARAAISATAATIGSGGCGRSCDGADATSRLSCNTHVHSSGEMSIEFVRWLKRYVSDGAWTDKDAKTTKADATASNAKSANMGSKRPRSNEGSSVDSEDEMLHMHRRTVPCIIDATGLVLLADALAARGRLTKEEIRRTPPLILTPNVNEIKILYRAVLARIDGDFDKVSAAIIRSNEHIRAAQSFLTDEEADLIGFVYDPPPGSSGITPSVEEMAVCVATSMRCCILLKGYEDYVTTGLVAGADSRSDARVGQPAASCASSPNPSSVPTPIPAATEASSPNIVVKTEEVDSGNSLTVKTERNGTDDAGVKVKTEEGCEETEEHVPPPPQWGGRVSMLADAHHATAIPCPRRVAGQGDVLSGLVGAFLAWDHISPDIVVLSSSTALSPSPTTDAVPPPIPSSRSGIPPQHHYSEAAPLCAIGASLVMKHCALFTAEALKTQRFVVSDMLSHISRTVDHLQRMT